MRYHDRDPNGFRALQRRMGYRVRPVWIWQRKRYGTAEVIAGFANDGVAGVPECCAHRKPGWQVLSQRLTRCRRAARRKGPAGVKAGIRHAIRWACAQPLNPDGFMTVQLSQGSRASPPGLIDYQRQATPTKTGARESKTSRGRL